MIATAAAFVLSFILSLALETLPPSTRAMRAPWRVITLRLTLHVVAFALAFAVSWRPWHAALVVCVATFLAAAGSGMKRNILGEPLTFSDGALVRNAIRHPRLYYAEKLAEPRALATFALLIVATTLWFSVEPSVFPSGGSLVFLAFPPAIALGAFALLRLEAAGRFAREVVELPPDPNRDVARFGLVSTLILHALAWRSMARPSPAAAAAAVALPTPRHPKAGPAVIVAIQIESFVDLAARGVAGPKLPAFERLKNEALCWGRCRVPAEGAYTMRSEFGFLTGLPSDVLGLDAFDPYLTVPPYAARAIPRLFLASGRRTTFLHPYDRRFFDRETLIPQLGFQRFIDGESFRDAERCGPYVADVAVADAIAAEIAGAREPLFLFVVTIENHGPWGAGRLPETDDPAKQYARHLVNADRMIARVAEALVDVPGGAALCLYGDHAPARTLHPGLPDRGATDYLLWSAREKPDALVTREDIAVDELGRRLLTLG